MEKPRSVSVLRKILAPIIAASALAGCDASCPSAVAEQTRKAIFEARLSAVCSNDFETARQEAPLFPPVAGDCDGAKKVKQLAASVHCDCLDGLARDVSDDLYAQANFMCQASVPNVD